ncbi:MAG: TIGR04283 family arsenosugar biosynthesis glycosyltransferase [Pseudomonadota bacterium]
MMPTMADRKISIVIPTLNAAGVLPACLNALVPAALEGLVKEVVVSDGGSQDDTLAAGQAAGAVIVRGARGRGRQLAAGARAARAPWLLFLHADTLLAPDWTTVARTHMERDDARAGAFRFRLDDTRWPARVLEAGVALRCALFGLPYGDQGLLVSRALYDAVGGFSEDMPLMEDVDMVRRIGRGRLEMLSADAVTSAERYGRDGYARRVMTNLRCLAMYYAGVAPDKIVGRYG